MKHQLISFALMALLAAPAYAHWPSTLEQNVPIVNDPTVWEGYPIALPGAQNRTLIMYGVDNVGNCYQVLDQFGIPQLPPYQLLTPALSFPQTNGFPAFYPDGQSGALAAWTNEPYDVHAQLLDSLGNRLWGDSGITIFIGNINYSDVDLCPDGQGGFWSVVSTEDSTSNVYAQHISPAGQLLLGPNGVQVAGLPNHACGQPRVAPDGQGGCFVTWDDNRPPYFPNDAILGNHLSVAGHKLWPEDLYFGINTNEKRIISDGESGFILQANPNQSDYNKHWRVNAQGDVLWVRDHLSWLYWSDMVSDDSEYFYLSFSYAQTCYAQKVRISDGRPMWPCNWQAGQYGAVLTNPPSNYYLQGFPRSYYLGPYFYISYAYTLGGIIYYQHAELLFLQRLNAQGNRLNGSMGTPLACIYPPFFIANYFAVNQRTVPDGEGGCVVVWENENGGGPFPLHDIFAKRVNADGTLGGPFPLDVMLTPHSLPILIPQNGGSFAFDVTIADTDSAGGQLDAWIEVTLPNGTTLEILARNDLAIRPDCMLTKTDLQQFVPPGAPAGIYTYTVYAGNHDYNSPWGQDSFTFEKLGARGWGLGAGNSEWTLEDWDEPSVGAQRAVPMPKPVD